MRTLRADEVYYDVNHNVAVALNAVLQMKRPGIAQDLYVKADQILELSATKYQVLRSEIFSSKLPSDPGLSVYVTDAVIENTSSPRYSIFGTPLVNHQTGAQGQQQHTWVQSNSAFFKAESVPFFYRPYVAGDAREPLGPVNSINVGYNQVFGFQLGVGQRWLQERMVHHLGDVGVGEIGHGALRRTGECRRTAYRGRAPASTGPAASTPPGRPSPTLPRSPVQPAPGG